MVALVELVSTAVLAEVVSTAVLVEPVGAAAALGVALVGEAVAGDGADRLSGH
ncbi:MAG TPA: hypothetical protein VK657_00105 [Terriglobales bacterium]|nr:hypothetical protein [Terriglobales bacterium]